MHYPPVTSKQDFVRRYSRGEFGNHSPTWNTPVELEQSNYKGLVHLRCRRIGGGGAYNVGPECALHLWQDQPDPSIFYCSGMAPHTKGTLQGEFGYVGGNFCLTYNTQQIPMRDGFKIETLHSSGILAWFLLQQHMCPNSFEWAKHLLTWYSGHIIEFSSFSVNWGTLPHHNTAFWEVRDY